MEEYTPDFNQPQFDNNPPKDIKPEFTILNYNGKEYKMLTKDYETALQEDRGCLYVHLNGKVELITKEELESRKKVVKMHNKHISKNYHKSQQNRR